MRSQCGHVADDEAGDRARMLEKVCILTRFAASTDSTISGLMGARKRLLELDSALPKGCPSTLEPFRPFWPLKNSIISLQWNQVSIYPSGGRGEGGLRSVASIKTLRGAMFNSWRELASESQALIRMSNSKLLLAPGSSPTDSVANETFVRGFETTLGTRATKSTPMPPSVTRGIERELDRVFLEARTVWAKYHAACATLANVQLYSNFLRGNEPWKQRWAAFQVQPYLERDCPTCGHRHLCISISDRTKTTDKPFDLVTVVPVTGAGLHSLRAAKKMLEYRAQVDRLLRANGRRSDFLFVREDGKPWNNDDFWKGYGLPALRRLKATGHPGLAGVDVDDTRACGIRMYRRGGEKFVMMANVNRDLVDLMARWRPRESQREPSIMRQRYYEMQCEDGVLVTAAAPARTAKGFAAVYDFEP